MSRMELKINRKRIAVLIGIKGETKERLEELSGCEIEIDSDEGDVILEGNDSVMLMDLRNVIYAIGRGFSPMTAEKLFNEEYIMEVISILDFTGKSKKKLIRMKGRVIGANGKARVMIEDLTGTEISVFGKTLAIIGKHEDVAVAKRACEALLSGAPHSNIFLALEKHKKQGMRF